MFIESGHSVIAVIKQMYRHMEVLSLGVHHIGENRRCFGMLLRDRDVTWVSIGTKMGKMS